MYHLHNTAKVNHIRANNVIFKNYKLNGQFTNVQEYINMELSNRWTYIRDMIIARDTIPTAIITSIDSSSVKIEFSEPIFSNLRGIDFSQSNVTHFITFEPNTTTVTDLQIDLTNNTWTVTFSEAVSCTMKEDVVVNKIGVSVGSSLSVTIPTKAHYDAIAAGFNGDIAGVAEHVMAKAADTGYGDAVTKAQYDAHLAAIAAGFNGDKAGVAEYKDKLPKLQAFTIHSNNSHNNKIMEIGDIVTMGIETVNAVNSVTVSSTTAGSTTNVQAINVSKNIITTSDPADSIYNEYNPYNNRSYQFTIYDGIKATLKFITGSSHEILEFNDANINQYTSSEGETFSIDYNANTITFVATRTGNTITELFSFVEQNTPSNMWKADITIGAEHISNSTLPFNVSIVNSVGELAFSDNILTQDNYTIFDLKVGNLDKNHYFSEIGSLILQQIPSDVQFISNALKNKDSRIIDLNTGNVHTNKSIQVHFGIFTGTRTYWGSKMKDTQAELIGTVIPFPIQSNRDSTQYVRVKLSFVYQGQYWGNHIGNPLKDWNHTQRNNMSYKWPTYFNWRYIQFGEKGVIPNFNTSLNSNSMAGNENIPFEEILRPNATNSNIIGTLQVLGIGSYDANYQDIQSNSVSVNKNRPAGWTYYGYNAFYNTKPPGYSGAFISGGGVNIVALSNPNAYLISQANAAGFNGDGASVAEYYTALTETSDSNVKKLNNVGELNFTSSFNGGSISKSNLTSVIIGDNVTSIGDIFKNSYYLSYISLSSNITSIGQSAFLGCTSLTSVVIPASVTSIEGYAFKGCTSLTSVVIPASVTSIGQSAFSESGLSTLPNLENKAIGPYTFSGAKLSGTVSIPGSISADYVGFTTSQESLHNAGGSGIIPYMAFYNNAHITNLIIGEGITIIAESAFESCRAITSVSLPNSLLIIERDAFRKISYLKSITIPSNVTKIGDHAFSGQYEGVPYLTSITNNSSLPLTIAMGLTQALIDASI